jgi:hypothetical protein
VCGGRAVEGAFADEAAFHLCGHDGDHEQRLVGDGLPVGLVEASFDEVVEDRALLIGGEPQLLADVLG